MTGEQTAFIIDDDPDVRDALQGLLRSVAIRSETFDSVETFIARDKTGLRGCLVLDVRLTGQSGLAFQSDLARRESPIPIIFISGHADVPMAVQAMKRGALEFLEKPVPPQALIDAIQHGFSIDRERRARIEELTSTTQAYATLTQREREVLELVIAGHPNKRTALQLGISEATVKSHRRSIMQKLNVESVQDLVRVHSDYVALGLVPGEGPVA
ncbi:response regulator transcription factor [Novosphingobium sp. AP12]|uniref:response regulator transcription factor n=1 Tax=Novosphingobium sp. AP12 TaxID=1144305 RepID=UPI000271E211|nr:response regulator [Novosphingobium sp. AP12]EJL33390.1 response regulator [Novosphingobium sp. AP12]